MRSNSLRLSSAAGSARTGAVASSMSAAHTAATARANGIMEGVLDTIWQRRAARANGVRRPSFGRAKVRDGSTRSPLDLGEIRNRQGCFTDLVEQLEAVGAHGGLVDVHRDLVEERVDRRPQLGDRRHGAGEILACDRGACLL